MGKICLLVVSSVLVLLLLPLDAGAQYFGRNKVEYEDFDFRVLRSEHFDIYYYPREERAARVAAQLAERWYTRFARILRHEFDRRQPLVLYGSQAEFAQTNVVSGLLPDSVGGVTESNRRRIAMPFAPTMAETNRVLGHEIVHAFQFDIGRRHGGTGQPLWFIEGMAEYLARGGSDPESQLWIRDVAASDRLPAKQGRAARLLSPYQYGHAFWSYLAGRFGDEVVEKALKPGKKQRKLNDRMRYATGLGLDELYAEWREAVSGAGNEGSEGGRRSDAAAGNGGADGGRRSLGGTEVALTWVNAGRMQLGPSLSPDGRQAVFFSERDRLSLDLFLANVETGQIVRKLATTAASARFDSLQPLRSIGAWSPNGEWFAFPAVRQGQAALMLLDMRGGGRDREIVLRDLGQILSPTWSPDGRGIAFSALAGGFTDLYTYDIQSGNVRKLTDDAFADLHPAWSPDGRSIAFASERFSSDLSSLHFGPPQLATIDVASGEVRALLVADPSALLATGPSIRLGTGPSTLLGESPSTSLGTSPSTLLAASTGQINPQWSSNGRQLYFVANRNGVANVFRFSLDTHAVRQVTSFASGVTGVTPTSPALSVASDASVVAFTVYRNGRHRLALLQGPDKIAGTRLDAVEQVGNGDTPDVPKPSGLVAQLLADDRTGLPGSETIQTSEYSPRLSLEQIGQPYVSSGGGPFGTFVRGGGGFLFGDMLGERRLGAAVQIGNRLRDAAFEARYLDQSRRWNWGALAELEPALRRYRRTEEIEHEGEPALLKQADYLERMQLRAAGLVSYPFSRGLRVELIGGM
ncbi:MAG: hypothetical protein EHM59_18120, partial [Betaproteobacteria bacterium]